MSMPKMGNSEVVTKALADGATAALRPNRMGVPDFQKEISPVYRHLKAVLKERYGQAIDVDLLDIGPGSAERQKAMFQQLQTSGAAQDEEVIGLARKLVAVIADENAESIWASNVAEPPEHLK